MNFSSSQAEAASDVRQWLREHYNDAVAVEIEAAGAAQAGHLNDGLPTTMIRDISDYGDDTKPRLWPCGRSSRRSCRVLRTGCRHGMVTCWP